MSAAEGDASGGLPAWWPFGAAAVVFAALTLLGAGGVRGTDQFWYVADAETVAAGQAPTTNQAFPVSVLEGLPLPRPFVHNVPAVYVVGLIAKAVDAYYAWILFGLLCSLSVGFIVVREVSRAVGGRAGGWAGATYLLLPLTVWLTTQPLLETWLALLIALAGVLLALPRQDGWKWVAASLVAGVLFWSRFTFLPLMAGVPIWFAIANRRRLADRWPLLVFLVTVVVGFVASGGVLFLSHHSFTFAEYVNGTAEWRRTDMLFVRPSAELDLVTFVHKAGGAFLQQIWPDVTAAVVFYWPFTLMVGVFLWIVSRDVALRREPWTVVAIAVLFVHLATVVLYRNQFRYMLPVTAPILIVVARGLADVRWSRFWRAVPALVGGLCLVIAISLALRSRGEGRATAVLRENLGATYREALDDSRAVLVDYPRAGGFVHAYVLRPRLVAYIDSSLGDEAIEVLRRRMNAGWVVTTEPRLVDVDSLRFVTWLPVGEVGDVGLYRIGP